MQIKVNSKSSRLLMLTQNMFIVFNNEIFAALNRQLSPSLFEKKCQNCVTIDINNISHCGSKNIGKKIFKQILDLVVITIRRIFLLINQLFQCELKRYLSLDFLNLETTRNSASEVNPIDILWRNKNNEEYHNIVGLNGPYVLFTSKKDRVTHVL